MPNPAVPDYVAERVSTLLPDGAAYAAALADAPEWRRRKCASLRLAADRRRSLAAWLLLRRLLAARGIAAECLRVEEGAFGKPFFPSLPNVHFSVSHSGDMAMAAVSDCPVGCDVERIADRTDDLLGFLAPDERRHVEAFPSGAGRDAAFFRLWVRKESRLKATGRGLGADTSSFSVLPDEFPGGWRFHDVAFAGGYVGCVCRSIMV